MHRTLVIGLVVLLAAWVCGSAPPSAVAQKQEVPQPQKKDYELRIVRVGNTFQGLRFKVTTGQAWILSGDSYEKIPETGPVLPGEYEITLVTDDTNWMAFRIDRLTGATWQLRDRKWFKMKEPE